jgi:hypothetical protein
MKSICKLIGKILIYIIICVFFFICLDYTAFLLLKKHGDLPSGKYSIIKETKFSPTEYFYNTFSPENPFPLREPLGINYKKNNITMFGCSYAYGSGVSNNETLLGNLSELTKRPVYNYGFPGEGIQHTLFKLDFPNVNKVIKNSDYIIQIFIGDHLFRMMGIMPYIEMVTYPTYIKDKNGKMKLNNSFLSSIKYSYFIYYIEKSIITRLLILYNDYHSGSPEEQENYKNRSIISKIENKLSEKFLDYYFNIIEDHYIAINNRIKQINPNAKFIILIYPDIDLYNSILETEKWNHLKDYGIEIVNVRHYLPEIYYNKDNTNKDCFVAEKYCVINGTSDDGHPNELAWKMVANLLVNDLKIIN